MDGFLCVFDEKSRDELIKNGFKLLCVKDIGDQTSYVFFNENNKYEKISLEKMKYLKTNNLTF